MDTTTDPEVATLIHTLSEKYGAKLETEDSCLEMIDKLAEQVSNLAYAVVAGDSKPLELRLRAAILSAACEQLGELVKDREVQ
jgi:hypothetical protein